MADVASNKNQKQTHKKRKTTRKKSVVDSAARNAASLTDGCQRRLLFLRS